MTDKIKIAIVDDSDSDYIRLKTIIEQWASSRNQSVEITYFESGSAFLERLTSQTQSFDAVCLDMMLPGECGLDVAKEIAEAFPNLPKVFYSSSIEYCCKSFVVNAVRYLLKSAFDLDNQVFECMDFLCTQINKRKSLKYDVSSAKGTVPLISCDDIVAVVASKNYVEVQTLSGDCYRQRKTMNQIFTELPKQFIRSSRKTIVNVKLIRQILKTEVIMTNNSVYKINEEARKKLFNMIKELNGHHA